MLTQGLGTILRRPAPAAGRDRRGQGRRRRRAVEGPLTALVPGLGPAAAPARHRAVDEAAAPRLRPAGYYREVYAGKPAWQGL